MQIGAKLTTRAAGILAAVVLALIAWYVMQSSAVTSDAVDLLSPSGPAAFGAADTARLAESDPAPTRPSAAVEPPIQRPSASNWFSTFSSRDPYPTAVALYHARQRGTFAAAFELQVTCLEGLATISWPPNQLAAQPTADDEYLPARLAAKQEIEVRCSRFTGQDILALAHPVTGDTHGERYRRVLDVFAQSSRPDRELHAVAEAFSQGMGAAKDNHPAISEAKVWRGESWRDRPQEFEWAIRLASRLATSDLEVGASSDLRDLIACYRGGQCKSYIDNVLANFPVERRGVVENLARDMAAAMQAGDLQLFMPSK
jgi:hypothetical protein